MIGRFWVDTSSRLGWGGESEVYALDAGRVLRVYWPGASAAYAERRRDFYVWLTEQGLPFELPLVLETGIAEDRIYEVERRMRGRVLSGVLPVLAGADRERALASYLRATEVIGGITLDDRRFGEMLVANEPLQRDTWSSFLCDRLMRSYEVGRPDLAEDVSGIEEILTRVLADLRALEPFSARRLVHGDYFPGNVYVDEDFEISGIGDFGYSTVVGDPLMDVAGAVAFLEVVNGYRPPDSIFLTRLARERHGDDVVRRLDLYRLYYSFFFSGCKADDRRTYNWGVGNLTSWWQSRAHK